MSSVPRLAAVQVSRVPPDPPSPRGGVEIVPLPEPRVDAFVRAALDAHDRAGSLDALATLWVDHVAGRSRACFESIHPDRILFVSRETREHGVALSLDDATMLGRVLCGEPQKNLAFERQVTVSTVSARCNRAFVKLGLSKKEGVPVPLVLSAQCLAGVACIASARSASFEHHGHVHRVTSVPRPATANLKVLTRAEQQVAQAIIEGCTRVEIARRRKTSVYTAAGQVHAIFTVLQATGRYDLIRRAANAGCFS